MTTTGVREALHAEGTKVRTAPGTGWLLLAVVATTVAVGSASAAASECTATSCHIDPVRTGLTGVQLGQAIVAVLAVLMIGDEYGTGMIRVTFSAMPRRTTVLVAKAAVLTGIVTAAAAVAVLASMLAGWLILPGHPTIFAGDGAVLRAAVGSVLYLVLIALLSLGVATAVRNSAAAVGIVLSLLYVLPIVTMVVSDPDWRRHLQQVAPTAGLFVQATVGVDDLPIGPWSGLAVLVAWAVAALCLGAVALRRDA